MRATPLHHPVRRVAQTSEASGPEMPGVYRSLDSVLKHAKWPLKCQGGKNTKLDVFMLTTKKHIYIYIHTYIHTMYLLYTYVYIYIQLIYIYI